MLQDPFILLGFAFVVLFILLAIGVQIAFALALVGIVGYFFYTGGPGMTSLIAFRALDSFVLTAIPLFKKPDFQNNQVDRAVSTNEGMIRSQGRNPIKSLKY